MIVKNGQQKKRNENVSGYSTQPPASPVHLHPKNHKSLSQTKPNNKWAAPMPKRKSFFFHFGCAVHQPNQNTYPWKKEKKGHAKNKLGIFFPKVATKLFSVFHTGHLFVIFDIRFYPWGVGDYQSPFSFWLPRKLIKILFGGAWAAAAKRGKQERLPLFSFTVGQSDIAVSKRVVRHSGWQERKITCALFRCCCCCCDVVGPMAKRRRDLERMCVW